MNKQKMYYMVMSAGAAIGAIASFWQTLEKLTLLKNPEAILSCNLSSALSCSNVLNSHQASLFGFPNSIMSLVLFVFFLAIGLVGLSGGQVTKRMRLTTEFISLFTLGFGAWFLFASTYVIHAICIFCIFNFAGILAINFAWLRLNSKDSPWLRKLTVKGFDVFIWLLLVLAVSASILFKFYL